MNILPTLPTLLSINRLCNLIMYSSKVREIEGAICEIGIYKGGSLEVLAKYNTGKDVFGIDSFEGLPEATENDFHVKGEFGDVDYYGIYGYFKMMYPHVKLLKGFTPKVFDFFEDHIRFSFAHVDLDMYTSVNDACDFLWPRMSEGGIIIFDDFATKSTPGATKAINEFFEDKHPAEKKELKFADGQSHKQYFVKK